MTRLLLLLAAALPAIAADWFLFTSFRRNGETGVYFAISEDLRKWTAIKSNRAWIQPGDAGTLMRDPFLTRGPDGTWHLLWTRGWTRQETGGALSIGHSTSKNLIRWTPHEAIPVMEKEPAARNAWAPEAVWDPVAKHWIVFWSSTIPGRFPDTERSGDSGYNHRLYSMTTRDWKNFSEAKLWFDPGFNCIDATVVRDDRRWILIFKDERLKPEKKNLRLAFATSPSGPWSGMTAPFSPAWVEGPSAIETIDRWWIFFDHYRQPRHYGAMRTRDWKTFESMTDQLTFPDDHRHGTVVRITESEAQRLQSASR